MRLASLLLGAMVGCGGSSPPPAPPTIVLPEAGSADATAQQEDTAPTPYTAEQLHAGCPAGRVIAFRMEVENRAPVIHVIRFVTSTAEGADIETSDLDEKGNLIQSAQKEHAAWDELRRHAAFPRSATTIEDGIADTPAGKFPSRVYTVHERHDVTTFYFALDRPGPPVLMVTERNGGRIRSMTLLPSVPTPAIACKTDDDCWIEDGKPTLRPKEHRGKKFKPCKDGEHAPVCRENACTIIGYKC
jgi:hypothetical protein